jgi:4-amino-4-deoxy-L-arabinose transferase-like glycosyltransferase
MQILIIVHIALMVISAALIVTAVFIARARKPRWLKRHKTFAISGVVTSLAAFTVIFIAKAGMQFPHFHSPHAIAGVLTLAILVATPIIGALIPKKPKALRPVHRVLGRIVSAAIILTALMGLLRFLQLSKG